MQYIISSYELKKFWIQKDINLLINTLKQNILNPEYTFNDNIYGTKNFTKI